GRFLRKLKRFAFNLRHQRKAKRVQRLNVALRFAQICDSGFSRNAFGFTYKKRHWSPPSGAAHG
ncbi:hypothetical protein, partial [Roseovarius sp. E0-M6]|uniref:hypothetical protein n=1 Tax=Roseovarius sp. E0-M6 TaxID=3127118 RepID=UPI003010524B